MANDRIYIRCRVCGNYMTLFKYLGGPLYLANLDSGPLDEWVGKHSLCRLDDPGNFPMAFNLEGEPGFDLFTESLEGFTPDRLPNRAVFPDGLRGVDD